MNIQASNNKADIMSLGVNVNPQGKDIKTDVSFKDYLKNGQAAKADSKTPYIKDASQKNAESKPQTDKVSKNESKVDDTKSSEVKKTDDQKAVKDDTENRVSDVKDDTQGEAVNAAAEDNELTDEEIAAVSEIITSIMNLISEVMGIDVSEVEDVLSTAGVELLDLTDTDTLKSFVLDVNDAEPVDILTNEELQTVISDMTEGVANIVAEAPVTEDVISKYQAIKEVKTEGVSIKEAPVAENKQDVEVDVAGETVKVTLETDKPKADTGRSERDFGQGNGENPGLSDQVMNGITEAVNQVAETEEIREVPQSEILRQVIDEIKLTAKQDTTSMELQLYPQHLGKLQIQVSTRNGAVTAQITAETEAARAAIESGLQSLKDAFNNQDLKVESIEVMVATSNFADNPFTKDDANRDENAGNGKSGRRNLDLNEIDENADNLTDDERLQADMMRAEGRRVDYQA